MAIASDHAGTELKAELNEWVGSHSHTVRDLGPSDGSPVDYPDFAERVARVVARGEARFGILICGSGVGMSIAANKVAGIRAVLVSNPVQARLARQHNDANVICLGARLSGSDMAKACVEAFLTTAFDPGDDGRHRRRVARITELETGDDSDS
ncbi:ribose 5-phosphate isomerase B [Lujinxingia litoralis]|uniref:ribose 5-phosphate isomerase B n=1 Tax=Lujinxingia litoralis TaxID=2211119 RepID=UPI003221626D